MTEAGQNENGNGNGQGGASARERVQVRLILDSMPNVAAFPPDWEDRPEGADYLYRTDSIIVRDANLRRVREIVNPPSDAGQEEQVREPAPEFTLPGATRLTLPARQDAAAASVHSLLEEIEAAEGPHAAGLDHLFYVCVHSCAAIEPEPAPANADPVPLPQTAAKSNHGLGVRVEVVDTGLLEDAPARHDWMAGVTGDVENPLGNDGLIRQDAGHGTFTAGCVRATAPAARVHVVDASQLPGRAPALDGIGAVFESELAELLHRRLVAAEGQEPVEVPDVMVLNFAGTTHNGAPPVALAALYDSVIQHLKELLIVCPAGNEGDKRKNWPASFAWVVSVGALDENDRQIATWSNRGRSVDVYAPGDRLVNAFATGKYRPTWDGQPNNPEIAFDGMATWSGTSFATPLVAGLVAARMSSTMQSSRRAWESLLTQAEQHALPGVGPVLFPGQELG